MSRRRITILGATGSIGASTLDVLRAHGGADAFEVVAVTANSDAAALAQIAREFRAKRAVVADEAALQALRAALAGSGIETAAGAQALVEAAAMPADWCMSAISGIAGLAPTLAAAKQGQVLALANKEALVCAGALVKAEVARSGARLLPVDSEHNAIFQVFDTTQAHAVERIILTASGGPFRRHTREQMAQVTVAEALKHPNWSMGKNITIDSATMMNKALEVIEAAYLFLIRPDQIEVLVHPQSVVHSMVGYVDGSVLAQLGAPDMRTPIAYALGWPARLSAPVQRLDFARLARLDFEAPDELRFPALRLARQALAIGAAAGAVLNGANEAARAAFLAGHIGFLDIAAHVEAAMDRLGDLPAEDLRHVQQADRAARAVVAERLLRAG